jgi:hypothetical protein
MPAAYEVRITPLMKGVPGFTENVDAGVTDINLVDTVLIEQFRDLDVPLEINEGVTASLSISSTHSIVPSLQPFAQALWIGYLRPEEEQAECIFHGPCNVLKNFDEGRVILKAYDPTLRMKHHYVRRGDEILNLDDDRGQVDGGGNSGDLIIETARNIPEQQDRSVPALGLEWYPMVEFGFDEAPVVGFERGQESWALMQTVARSAYGPDLVVSFRNSWKFPITKNYAALEAYTPPGDPAAPDATQLGRNLDPVDPDDPGANEVIFEHGVGTDSVSKLNVDPGIPVTHVHVLDASRRYRVTRADAASSEDVGVFVRWVVADFDIPRPGLTMADGTIAPDPPDLGPLEAIAESIIKGWGVPPEFITMTLRPDDAQTWHFGHPGWFAAMPGFRIGGKWWLGDYVRVRAVRDLMTLNGLYRIIGVRFKQEGSNGLPVIEVRTVPAIGGTPGTDSEETL